MKNFYFYPSRLPLPFLSVFAASAEAHTVSLQKDLEKENSAILRYLMARQKDFSDLMPLTMRMQGLIMDAPL